MVPHGSRQTLSRNKLNPNNIVERHKKIKNDDFVDRTGTTLSELVTTRRAEKAAERGKYLALERVCQNATHSVTRRCHCSLQRGGRRSPVGGNISRGTRAFKRERGTVETRSYSKVGACARAQGSQQKSENARSPSEAGCRGGVEPSVRGTSDGKPRGDCSFAFGSDKVEKERDNLISVIFEGGSEGLLLLAQYTEQPGMLLQEPLGLQKMQHGHA